MTKTIKKDFKKLTLIEQERLREVISQKLSNAMRDIDEATGYYSEIIWCIYADELSKSVDIDLSLALLTRPHNINETKVKHFLKHNPHNCLNEKILVFKWNNWYEIYNGVHRSECLRKKGKKTIKADIIIPDRETLEKRNLLKN